MLLRRLIVGLLVVFGTFQYATGQIVVCSNCDISTIKEGIEAANPFDTLRIKEGVYLENSLLINKPLTIIGEEGVILDGEKAGSILLVQANDVHIESLTLRRIGLSHTEEFAAIHLSNSEDFSLKNLIVEDAFFGFLIENCENGVIRNNILSGESDDEFYSGNGIHAWKSENLTIENNTIRNLRDAIYLEFVSDTEVRGNFSEQNVRYGLHFMFSNHNSYSNNVFKDNGAGVAVMFSKFIQIRENQFIDNWGTASFGLLLKEIYDADIVGNTFGKNTVAIAVEGSTRINYKNNDFEHNGWGIKMSGGCYTNTFSGNSFLNNSFDVSFNSRMNDNLFSGNYWSSYSGYDLNKDGIGDVPHRPVKLFSYVVNRTPESIVLLRSIFVDLINFTENVTPIFTPVDLIDESPLMEIPS